MVLALPTIVSIVAPRAVEAQTSICSQFTDQNSCENPLKACGAPNSQFFCRWRGPSGSQTCICTNS